MSSNVPWWYSLESRRLIFEMAFRTKNVNNRKPKSCVWNKYKFKASGQPRGVVWNWVPFWAYRKCEPKPQPPIRNFDI